MTDQPTPEHESTTGARPTGISDPAAAAQNIQQMFDHIAPTYDRANHVLSAGLDRWMWNRAARTFRTTSAEWAKRTAPGDDLYGQRSLSDVIPLGGGVPIVVNGDVIGAVGISGANGGMPREEACSKAGIAAIQGQLS